MRVVIVGAGQAGLAMGYALAHNGLEPQRDFVIIDAAQPGHLAWDRRWDSLRLFTTARSSALPGVRFPGEQNRYPTASEVSSYLDGYAQQLGLRPRWGVSALEVSEADHGHGLRLVTSDGAVETRNVVAATGPFSHPRYPELAHEVVVAGVNIHSDDYRRPDQVPAGTVMIVGAGNTGMQLAHELSDTHEVILAAGAERRALPQSVLGIDTLDLLRAAGAMSVPVTTSLGRRLSRSEPVVGQSIAELEARGVRVVERLAAARGNRFATGTGRSFDVDSVIWATGYDPGASWLPPAVRGPGGAVLQRRGVTSIAGLYTLGLPWMHTRGSALLGGVGRDAAYLARLIAKRP